MSSDRQSKHTQGNQQQRANAGHAPAQAKTLQAKGVLQQKKEEDLSVHDAEYVVNAPQSKQSKPVLQGRYGQAGANAFAARRDPVQMVISDDRYMLENWDDTYSKDDEVKAVAEKQECDAELVKITARIAEQDAIITTAKPATRPKAQAANEKNQGGVIAQYNTAGNWNKYNGGLTKGHWTTAAVSNTLMDDPAYHTSPNKHIYGDDEHRNDAFNPLELPMAHLLKDGYNFHIPTMTPTEQEKRNAADKAVTTWQAHKAAAIAEKGRLENYQGHLTERVDFLNKVKEGADQAVWSKKYFS